MQHHPVQRVVKIKIQEQSFLGTLTTDKQQKKRSEEKACDLWFAALAVGGALITITFKIVGELFAALYYFSPDQKVGEFGLELRENLYIHIPYEERERKIGQQTAQDYDL